MRRGWLTIHGFRRLLILLFFLIRARSSENFWNSGGRLRHSRAWYHLRKEPSKFGAFQKIIDDSEVLSHDYLLRYAAESKTFGKRRKSFGRIKSLCGLSRAGLDKDEKLAGRAKIWLTLTDWKWKGDMSSEAITNVCGRLINCANFLSVSLMKATDGEKNEPVDKDECWKWKRSHLPKEIPDWKRRFGWQIYRSERCVVLRSNAERRQQIFHHAKWKTIFGREEKNRRMWFGACRRTGLSTFPWCSATKGQKGGIVWKHPKFWTAGAKNASFETIRRSGSCRWDATLPNFELGDASAQAYSACKSARTSTNWIWRAQFFRFLQSVRKAGILVHPWEMMERDSHINTATMWLVRRYRRNFAGDTCSWFSTTRWKKYKSSGNCFAAAVVFGRRSVNGFLARPDLARFDNAVNRVNTRQNFRLIRSSTNQRCSDFDWIGRWQSCAGEAITVCRQKKPEVDWFNVVRRAD